MVAAKWIVGFVLASVIGVAFVVPLTAAKTTHINLQPGPFAPDAQGEIEFTVVNGVLSGKIEAEKLPAQGAHAFYVLWFVRTDSGDKAFLGPIVGHDSILFLTRGDGEMRFAASAFTAGPDAGSGISFGPTGKNFFVVIAENHIDTFMPFPVSAPPSSFALTATF
jgi:hypothetical protein